MTAPEPASRRVDPAALELHDYAQLFPHMSDAEFEILMNSIANGGLVEPITLFHGKVLDGRNRWQGCLELGVEPAFEEFDGTDAQALRFVVAKNAERRHLTKGQRAMIAGRLANFHHGGSRRGRRVQDALLQLDEVPVREAAARLNVSARYVGYARDLERSRVLGLAQLVWEGRMTLSNAFALDLADRMGEIVDASKSPEELSQQAEWIRIREAERKLKRQKATALTDEQRIERAIRKIISLRVWGEEWQFENEVRRVARFHNAGGQKNHRLSGDVRLAILTGAHDRLVSLMDRLPDAIASLQLYRRPPDEVISEICEDREEADERDESENFIEQLPSVFKHSKRKKQSSASTKKPRPSDDARTG